MTVDTLGRAVGLYRRTAASRSALALVVANVIPIVGVLFFGWSLMTILVLYWVENGIVGFWNVPKIAMARGSLLQHLPDMPDAAALAATGSPERAAALQAAWRRAQQGRMAEMTDAAQQLTQDVGSGEPSSGSGSQAPIIVGPQAAARLSAVPRLGLSIFFLVHYGMFWLGHGLFVFLFLPAMSGSFSGSGPNLDCVPALPGEFGPGFGPGFGQDCASPMGEILWGSVVIGAIALFISHGASFLFNFIGRAEYLTKSPASQMAAPYGRVVVLHLTIIFGGMVVAFLGAPIGALLVLVGLKTIFDLSLHLREHRAADREVPPALQGTI